MRGFLDANLLDFQLPLLASRVRPQLEAARGVSLDEGQAISAAHVALCVERLFEVTMADAIECLTEASVPVDLDAMWLGDVVEQEFVVALFRGAYTDECSTAHGSPDQDGSIRTIRQLFASETDLPPRLAARVAEVYSLMRDGYRPRIHFYWYGEVAPPRMPAPQVIDSELGRWPTSFAHIHNSRLICLRISSEPISDTLKFSGKVLIEGLDYARVVFGKLRMSELVRLLETHGPSLLEPSLRHPLPFGNEELIEWVDQFLKDPAKRDSFPLYSEGVVLLCEDFSVGERGSRVAAQGLRALPGSPASNAIWRALSDPHRSWGHDELDGVYVWVRLVQAGWDRRVVERTIVFAAQCRRLAGKGRWHTDDKCVQTLTRALRSVGYSLHLHPTRPLLEPTEIDLEEAAKAVLAVWRRAPHLASRWSRALVARDCDEIFGDLAGAQIVLAVRLTRLANHQRIQPPDGAPLLVHYAAAFAAMLMGERLLADLKTDVEGLALAFDAAQTLVDADGIRYFEEALRHLEQALQRLYAEVPLSLERLASTFRRGDLLEML